MFGNKNYFRITKLFFIIFIYFLKIILKNNYTYI